MLTEIKQAPKTKYCILSLVETKTVRWPHNIREHNRGHWWVKMGTERERGWTMDIKIQ